MDILPLRLHILYIIREYVYHVYIYVERIFQTCL